MRYPKTDFDLPQIYRSGQVFTWSELSDAPLPSYRIHSGAHVAVATQHPQHIEVACEPAQEAYWHSYFDMDTDYAAIKSTADAADTYLQNAIQLAGGVRILRQDFWDTTVSFLISQCNNIKRITGSVQGMLAVYGRIPTPQQLAACGLPGLARFGLGYRDKYLYEAACAFTETDIFALCRSLPYAQAHARLMQLHGVGKKVADCICLFGLHQIEAFPLDTHVKQLLAAHYPNGFPMQRYASCAGALQQYMFYYELHKPQPSGG